MTREQIKKRYPLDWDLIAGAVKAAHGFKCEACGHVDDPATYHTLTVHHLIPIPSLCEPWNLAALCQRCHLRTQNTFDIRQEPMFELPAWLKPHRAGFIAWKDQQERRGREALG